VKKLLEDAYYASPVALQNLAVTLYGWRLRAGRQSEATGRHVSALLESQWWSDERIRQFQLERLREFVALAVLQTPAYSSWRTAHDFEPRDLRTLGDLRLLPVTEKQEVRSRPQDYALSPAHRPPHTFTLATSGTSGTPLTVYTDRESRAHHYAFYERLRHWFKVGPDDWRATFYGRVIQRASQTKPPFWRVDAAQKNVLFSSYHLSRVSVRAYAAELRRRNPRAIYGYPSSLASLAALAEDEGVELSRPAFVMTTAETLLAHQRRAIERAFACRVTDQYGCTEMTHFVSQCEEGEYHVHPEHGIVEVLDPAGQPLSDGEAGELVVTGLVNRTMPLLRYRTGDVGALAARGCRCKRAFPVLAGLEGRMDDVIVTPDGRRVGRLDPVLKGEFDVREAQFEQTDDRTLVARLVPAASLGPAQLARLKHEIQQRIGTEMEVRLELVESIPRGPNGKFRAVISKRDRDATHR
jgi:phenylacetate-CoA ligase